MKKTIYIDMDGVLCDFAGRKEEILKKHPEIAYPQT